MSSWQPIETAPKDGTEIVGLRLRTKQARVCSWRDTRNYYHPVFGRCNTDTWWMDDTGEIFDPTHWQPLPEPPEMEGGK